MDIHLFAVHLSGIAGYYQVITSCQEGEHHNGSERRFETPSSRKIKGHKIGL